MHWELRVPGPGPSFQLSFAAALSSRHSQEPAPPLQCHIIGLLSSAQPSSPAETSVRSSPAPQPTPISTLDRCQPPGPALCPCLSVSLVSGNPFTQLSLLLGPVGCDWDPTGCGWEGAEWGDVTSSSRVPFLPELGEGDVQVPVAQLWQSPALHRGHQTTRESPPPRVGARAELLCLGRSADVLHPPIPRDPHPQILLRIWLAEGPTHP